ncbi:hypothetical protein ACWGOQ_0021335 [Aquimarina sp. M1]
MMFRERNINNPNTRLGQSHLFQPKKSNENFIQPKLKIGEPGDKYEVEADDIADKVVTNRNTRDTFLNQSPVIQKQPNEEVQKKEDDEWHKDTFSGNNHMPYEIQVIFQNVDKNTKYVIPEEHKYVFDEWKKSLVKHKQSLSGQPGKEGIINIFNLIITAIRNGIFPEKMMQILKKGDSTFQTASDWNKDSDKSCGTITEADVIAIFKKGDLFKQLEANDQGRACTVIENNQCLKSKEEYLAFLKDKNITKHINDAFKIMGIDTIKSQAVYLAHAAGESNNLMSLTETKNKWMATYRGGENFRGRGAFHTTHKDGYSKVLAYLDALLDNDTIAEGDKEKIREASDAIKNDVTKASDPKYTFIFSAAYMHMAGGVAKSGDISESPSFLGTGSESSWVAGQNINELKEKEKFIGRAKLKAIVYKNAMEILGNKKCTAA